MAAPGVEEQHHRHRGERHGHPDRAGEDETEEQRARCEEHRSGSCGAAEHDGGGRAEQRAGDPVGRPAGQAEVGGRQHEEEERGGRPRRARVARGLGEHGGGTGGQPADERRGQDLRPGQAAARDRGGQPEGPGHRHRVETDDRDDGEAEPRHATVRGGDTDRDETGDHGGGDPADAGRQPDEDAEGGDEPRPQRCPGGEGTDEGAGDEQRDEDHRAPPARVQRVDEAERGDERRG